MTELQAKQILLRHRPGSPEADGPEFAEALAMLSASPELRSWFDTHCAMQQAIRGGFKKISPPPGLKEQILSERKASTTSFLPRSRAALAAAVVSVAVILGLLGYWLGPSLNRTDDTGLAFYRDQMIGRVVRAYNMDLETNSLSAVRSYLASRRLDTDWHLPKGLENMAVTGCGVLGWQDTGASMICFHSGRTSVPKGKTDVMLFVVDRRTMTNPPPSGKPVVTQVDQMMTASWSEGDKVYLLAVQGDEALLKELL